jgi:hypothetical protein
MAGKSKSSSGSSSKSRSTSSGSSAGDETQGAAQLTIDHDQIRQWVEERGGKPACVKGTEKGDSCLLRIDMPGGAGEESLQDMRWEDFFDVFEKRKLAFLYQDEKVSGEPSTFSKLIDRDSAEDAAHGAKSSGGKRKSSGGHGRSAK